VLRDKSESIDHAKVPIFVSTRKVRVTRMVSAPAYARAVTTLSNSGAPGPGADLERVQGVYLPVKREAETVAWFS
jgi:hypothetical protein